MDPARRPHSNRTVRGDFGEPSPYPEPEAETERWAADAPDPAGSDDSVDQPDLAEDDRQDAAGGAAEDDGTVPESDDLGPDDAALPEEAYLERGTPEDDGSEAAAAQHSGGSRVETGMATAGTITQPWGGAGNAALHGRLGATTPSSPSADAAAAASMDPGSDAAIMLRVRDGDDTGFTYLIEKYRKQMIHYMFRMTGNLSVAEELAQEVFLRVYRSRESYRAEAKFTTWLYRIATNLGVNHARDHRHEKAAQNVYLDQPDAETGTTPEVADSRRNAEQTIMRSERMAGIRAQVMSLPERQRQAVLMHKYQEMDYREISAVLKLSESATKSLLFRAYQTLRERLKDYV